jgi:uridine kinase
MAATTRKRPLIIGVAGGTGSGKTTVARRLAKALDTRCVTIEHDSYYRDRSDLSPGDRAGINYDHPDSLETELLIEHIRRLRSGRGVDVPQYDFVTHLRAEAARPIEPAPVVLVEGILTLADPSLRALMDIKIFVDTDADIRVFRRIRRDLEQRGRTFQSVRDRYYKFVRPMHLQFVEPSKRWADLIIPEGGDNEVAIDLLVTKLSKVAEEEGLDTLTDA